jgi:hypothetical protein
MMKSNKCLENNDEHLDSARFLDQECAYRRRYIIVHVL